MDVSPDRNSWRETGGEHEGAELDRGRSWEGRGRAPGGWDDQRGPGKRPDDGDHLPEWAMENPSDHGGSFDATGAFHGGTFSDEEDFASNDKKRHDKSYDKAGNDMDDAKDDSGASKPFQMSNNSSEPKPAPERSQSGTPIQEAANHTPANVEPSLPNIDDVKAQSAIIDSRAPLTSTFYSKPTTEVVKPVVESFIAHVDKQCFTPTNGKRDKPQQHTSPVAKQDDDMDFMQKKADDLVAKLTEDEEQRPKVKQQIDIWYYRDPQGTVQGPFASHQMKEWLNSGYFNHKLEVRRECDALFNQLGDLIRYFGAPAFQDWSLHPPLMGTENLSTSLPASGLSLPSGVVPSPSAVPATGVPLSTADPYYQYQLLTMRASQSNKAQMPIHSSMDKFMHSESWTTLTAIEQQAMTRHLLARAEMQTEMQSVLSQQQAANNSSDALAAFMNQIQQKQLQQQQQVESVWGTVPTATSPAFHGVLENWQQQAPPPAPHGALPGTLPGTLPGALPGALPPPGQGLPASLWDLQHKEAEQHMLEEQLKAEQLKTQERQKLEEIRQAAEAERRRQQLEAEAAKAAEVARQQVEAELRRKEEEKLRLEKEMRRLIEEEEARKAEVERQRLEEQHKLEQLRLEEERQRALVNELARQQEELRQKQEEEQKRREAERLELERKAKEEEDQRKESERKRKKQEEALKKQQALLAQQQLLQQQQQQAQAQALSEKKEQEVLRQQEALRQLREQQQQAQLQHQHIIQQQLLQQQQQAANKTTKSAPWTAAASTRNNATSLAEIQKLQEKEKREQEKELFILAKAQQVKQQEASAALNKTELPWADHSKGPSTPIKSLAEIQAEEQRQLAKQQARVKSEITSAPAASAGIWTTASSSLTWSHARPLGGTSPAPSNVWAAAAASAPPGGAPASAGQPTNSIWGSTTATDGGLWDEVQSAPSPPKNTTTSNKTKSGSNSSTTVAAAPAAAAAKNKANKSRTKKEEQQVMKLFEQKNQFSDDFTNWCMQTLSGLQSSVDIPTFVGFLKDIESPDDVIDIVRSYLGDGREARSFARSFLERRSKWRNSQKTAVAEDDMCKPAPAVNPMSNDFPEAKTKSKKAKKSKMFRVADNRILGFSVTAAQDRINVGDRDYGEGM